MPGQKARTKSIMPTHHKNIYIGTHLGFRTTSVTREVSPSRADEGPTDEKSKLGQVRMI